MPRIYRAMTRDLDCKPKVGQTARNLGVRPSGDGQGSGDVPVIDGSVFPGTGGMSVAPHWWDLPAWRIPNRYDVPGKGRIGRGKVEDACWRMGDGSFINGPVSDRLALVVDSETHGAVEPMLSMLLDAYQAALAETRDSWIEEPSP